ncbi:Pleckstrin homology domain, Mcp5-type, partial [Cynara cardunculus var. scolymus]
LGGKKGIAGQRKKRGKERREEEGQCTAWVIREIAIKLMSEGRRFRAIKKKNEVDCYGRGWYVGLDCVNLRMTSDVSRAGGQVERDIEQAITALKKGAYLLKYGRRGKPKFCPFRLANDESILIWFSGKEEKHLKLSDVTRIVSGQQTPIFQRYPRPEKEYQSFSLIYNDRSLDLICKDKDEAEVWFSGLKALISRGRQRNWRTESRSDEIPSEANSPRTYTQRSSPLHSPFGSGNSSQKVPLLV